MESPGSLKGSSGEFAVVEADFPATFFAATFRDAVFFAATFAVGSVFATAVFLAAFFATRFLAGGASLSLPAECCGMVSSLVWLLIRNQLEK